MHKSTMADVYFSAASFCICGMQFKGIQPMQNEKVSSTASVKKCHYTELPDLVLLQRCTEIKFNFDS